MAENHRIVPQTVVPDASDEESLDAWGFRDSGFEITENGHVRMRGSRYPLSGQELPALIPWIRGILQVDLDLDDVHTPHYPPPVPKPRVGRTVRAALEAVLRDDQIVVDDETRVRHAHGHTQEDMWAIRYGSLERIPDVVVYPESDEEVQRIVEAAISTNAAIIPYGGGTNVSEALSCPVGERRTIISVDLARMNRVRWIDPVNHTACVEAGAVGRYMQKTLAPHGFTIGHEPDSIEFATLGGWIATNASGMKKNRYGNIEDLVEDLTAVLPDGVLRREHVGPRESVGPDLRSLLFGSEGDFGIITSAVVRIFPLPEVQRFDSILFHSFEDGVAFMHELTRAQLEPASVRLVDNMQFQFSQALKPASVGLKRLKSRLQKWIVTRVKRFDPERMVACTLVYEGAKDEVASHQRKLRPLIRRHSGMLAGAENGRRGYAMTFAIAYIRDFIMRYHIIAESFETSVAWSDLEEMCRRVKERVYVEHSSRELPGRPYVTCRVTQVYPSGACVYFYLAFYSKGLDRPNEVFSEIERAARDEVLASGGTLSHHHGIGKIRAPFADRIVSQSGGKLLGQLKKAIDPKNVFAAGNGLLAPKG